LIQKQKTTKQNASWLEVLLVRYANTQQRKNSGLRT